MSARLHDVFISYAKDDKNVAFAVCHGLEGEGLRCWIAPRDITPGGDFPAEIVRGIRSAGAFVIVFSGASNGSPHVAREVHLAAEARMPLVPFRLEDARPTERLGYYLSATHWMDAIDPPIEEHIDGLAAVLKKLIGMEDGPPSTQPEPTPLRDPKPEPATQPSSPSAAPSRPRVPPPGERIARRVAPPRKGRTPVLGMALAMAALLLAGAYWGGLFHSDGTGSPDEGATGGRGAVRAPAASVPAKAPVRVPTEAPTPQAPVPPVLAITSPQQADFVKDRTIRVTGTVEHLPPGGKVWVNEVAARFTQDLASKRIGFSAELSAVAEGRLDILARIEGASASDTRIRLTVDRTAPVISISSPASLKLTTEDQRAVVRGSVTEANLEELRVDGERLTRRASADGEFGFAHSASLAEGETKRVTFTAIDLAGNEAKPVTVRLTREKRAAPTAPVVPPWAHVSARQLAEAKKWKVPVAYEASLGAGVTMKFVLIPAGTFWMGSPKDEERREERYATDEVRHRVTLTRPYYLSIHEVTNAQFRGFRSAHDRKSLNHKFHKGPLRPAVYVDHTAATGFARWLGEREGTRSYRLPTEAEWEHATRAGSEGPFWWGASITRAQANYNGNYTYGGGAKGTYSNGPTDVGTFRASPWGLYDVHGNVSEWCADWHRSYRVPRSTNAVSDPTGPNLGPTGPAWGGTRVLRGGSCFSEPWYLRSAAREGGRPDGGGNAVGFRVAASLPSR